MNQLGDFSTKNIIATFEKKLSRRDLVQQPVTSNNY